MGIKKNRTGEKYLTKEGDLFEIIEYFDCKNCTIKFTESGLILHNRNYVYIKSGAIRNPLRLSFCGIGYLGYGKYNSCNSQKLCRIWSNILNRCYKSFNNIKNISYDEMSVCEEWHNFQNFAKWYEDNWKEYMQGWHLDKDILVKANKIYSPETCCFVPQEINALFTKRQNYRGVDPIGVHNLRGRFSATISLNSVVTHLGMFDTPEEAFKKYKNTKEQHIKEVADKWKGKISDKLYEAMYNYTVEITD